MYPILGIDRSPKGRRLRERAGREFPRVEDAERRRRRPMGRSSNSHRVAARRASGRRSGGSEIEVYSRPSKWGDS
jgi:hypothetical protein